MISGKHEVVGKAIRMEIDTSNNTMYLVFQITQESFAQKVREDWSRDIPVSIKGKDLVLEKEVR